MARARTQKFKHQVAERGPNTPSDAVIRTCGSGEPPHIFQIAIQERKSVWQCGQGLPAKAASATSNPQAPPEDEVKLNPGEREDFVGGGFVDEGLQKEDLHETLHQRTIVEKEGESCPPRNTCCRMMSATPRTFPRGCGGQGVKWQLKSRILARSPVLRQRDRLLVRLKDPAGPHPWLWLLTSRARRSSRASPLMGSLTPSKIMGWTGDVYTVEEPEAVLAELLTFVEAGAAGAVSRQFHRSGNRWPRL